MPAGCRPRSITRRRSRSCGLWEEKARTEDRWPEALIDAHDQKYGSGVKAPTRARNASYFAELFARHKIDHFHVHFANRAAHTALFLKAMANIPFSITAHGQDFMADLGNDDLLREICDAAEFVAVETEYSRGLMAQRCPKQRARFIGSITEWIWPISSIPPHAVSDAGPVQILSVGRLVAFKGFEYLIEACEQLRQRGIQFRCEIVGDGPLRESLQQQIDELRLGAFVTLAGRLAAGLRPRETAALRYFRAGLDGRRPRRERHLSDRDSGGDGLRASGGFHHGRRHSGSGRRQRNRIARPGRARAGCSPTRSKHSAEISELRARYGAAGRARIEQHFQVEITVQPLLEICWEKARPATAAGGRTAPNVQDSPRIAYLIDRWPDEALPSLETELL